MFFIIAFNLYTVLKDIVSKELQTLLFVMFLFPAMGTAVYFSPGLQSLTTFAAMIWSFSLIFQKKYHMTGLKKYLFISLGLYILSLLTYEIPLTLLPINLCLPFLIFGLKEKNARIQFIQLLVSFFLIGIFILVFQKGIAPMYAVNIPEKVRITSISGLLISFVRALFHYSALILLDLPHALIGSLVYVLIFVKLFIILPVIGLIGLSYYFGKKGGDIFENIKQSKNNQKDLLYITLIFVFFMFGLNAVLHTPVGSVPTLKAYSNRAVIGMSFTIPFLIYLLSSLIPNLKRRTIFMSFMTCLYIFTFLVQRDNYIHSYAITEKIQNDIQEKIKNLKDSNPQVNLDELCFLADVPLYAPNNLLKEITFNIDTYDLQRSLAYRFGTKVKVSTINIERVKYGDVTFSNDNQNYIHQGLKCESNKTYIYTYLLPDGLSKMNKIESFEAIKELVSSPKNNPFYTSSFLQGYLDLKTKLRNFVRNTLGEYGLKS